MNYYYHIEQFEGIDTATICPAEHFEVHGHLHDNLDFDDELTEFMETHGGCEETEAVYSSWDFPKFEKALENDSRFQINESFSAFLTNNL